MALISNRVFYGSSLLFFFSSFVSACACVRKERKKKRMGFLRLFFFFFPLRLRKRADQVIKWRRCAESEEEAKTKEKEKMHTPNCGSFLRISVAFIENGNVSRNVRVKGDLVHASWNVLRCLWKGVFEQESHRAQKRSSIVLFGCCCFVFFFNASQEQQQQQKKEKSSARSYTPFPSIVFPSFFTFSHSFFFSLLLILCTLHSVLLLIIYSDEL